VGVVTFGGDIKGKHTKPLPLGGEKEKGNLSLFLPKYKGEGCWGGKKGRRTSCKYLGKGKKGIGAKESKKKKLKFRHPT